MKKIDLLFGLHMHQPVDNFAKTVDEAIKLCYKPLFKTLKKFPTFKFALHSSGWLLEYIKKYHKELFDDIKDMTDKNQIEFFTGGFYEPILSSIPKDDAISQIKLLTEYIQKEFNTAPKGLWLTERVWDDSIIEICKKSKIDYAMVDDYHFIASGMDKNSINGYYLTEYNGDKLALFAIAKDLRYAIPFNKPTEAINTIKEQSEVAVIFDDAEKFGLWPNTNKWVYKEKWLEKFLTLLTKDKDITTSHFSKYYNSNRAKGIIYLQNFSYYEMNKWALKTDNQLEFIQIEDELKREYPNSLDKFLKGATWKNFFIKYEESNRLHKRMIEVSKNRKDNQNYLNELYKLQTNDVFWHGIFGGIYLPNLRDNAYSYLCKCENMRYKKESIEVADIDFNGYEEVKCVCDDIIVRFDSKNGGQMVEFLQRDKHFNWQNTITRREEAYHKDILNNSDKTLEQANTAIETIHNLHTKVDDTIKEALFFDWYIKNSFIDHISNDSFNIKSFKECSFKEFGDFANMPFDLELDKKRVIFKRNGGIYDDKEYNTTITKEYKCHKNRVDFNIQIDTKAQKEYLYILEFNLHFASLKNALLQEYNLENEMIIPNIDEFKIYDKYTNKKIKISLNRRFTLISVPLQSVSKKESGYELVNQGVSFALIFDLNKSLKIEGKLKVKDV